MPEEGNTAEEVERGFPWKEQKPLKYVPFIFKPFPVWEIAYKVHKTALWQPSKTLAGVDSYCMLLVSQGGKWAAVTRLWWTLSCLQRQTYCRLSVAVLPAPQVFICGIKTSSILTRLRDPLCQLHSMTCIAEMNRYPERMTSDYSLIHYLCRGWAEMITLFCPPESRADQRLNCEGDEFILIYLECISASLFPTLLISSMR